MKLGVENVETMTPEQERDFWTVFSGDVARDDGSAVRQHFAAGNPVYCRMPDTPEGLIEKRFPDGRRQYVKWERDGEHVVSEARAS